MSDVSIGRHRGKAARRHPVLRGFGYTILTLTLAIGLFSVYTYRHLNENLTNVDLREQLGDDRPAGTPKGDGQPINVLVMGSDTRDGEGNDAVGGAQNVGQRSDTTILMHVSGDRSFAYGVSIPRDAMVERPTCYDEDLNEIPGGFGMWNKAFDLGGPACTIRQVEQLTGIRVDHWVVVDFNGFKGMVDALDGVEVCIPEDVNDTVGNIYLEAGTRTVSGDEALDYVRVRHGIGLRENGDIGRMKRQQAFVASMANKVMSKGMLAHPKQLLDFLDAATKSLTLDHELDSIIKIADLGAQFQEIGLSEIQFITVPWRTYQPDKNRVEWVPEEAEELWQLIREDRPLSRRLSAEAITADTEPGTRPTEEESQAAGPDQPSAPETSQQADDPESILPDPNEKARESGLC
ncbi:LCP family protein [Nocardioides sp. AE5]|uniref:LCP family protein n=1 Tax=Nocardioides sp. AE5 TaxID=2962573 RepID=UPI002882A7A6|nr:LCP family protein [Nocardioides sp. AE5]MDT0203114.1 LCP family protein [Nocardioides sp. AE5]